MAVLSKRVQEPVLLYPLDCDGAAAFWARHGGPARARGAFATAKATAVYSRFYHLRYLPKVALGSGP